AQNERRRHLEPEECRQLLDCFHVSLCYPDEVEAASQQADVSWPMAIRVLHDSKFGPYIMFDSGGQAAQISNAHQAVELPPLNSYLARKLVLRSRLWHRVLSRQLTPAAF